MICSVLPLYPPLRPPLAAALMSRQWFLIYWSTSPTHFIHSFYGWNLLIWRLGTLRAVCICNGPTFTPRILDRVPGVWLWTHCAAVIFHLFWSGVLITLCYSSSSLLCSACWPSVDISMVGLAWFCVGVSVFCISGFCSRYSFRGGGGGLPPNFHCTR